MNGGTVPRGGRRLGPRPGPFALALSLSSLVLAGGALLRGLDFWTRRAPRDGRPALTSADFPMLRDGAPPPLAGRLRRTNALLAGEGLPVLASSLLAAFFLSPRQAVILSLAAGSGLLLRLFLGLGGPWALPLQERAAALLLFAATLDWGSLLLIHLLLLAGIWSDSFPSPPSASHPP